MFFLRILHQYGQVLLAQQGDELAEASIRCVPEAVAALEHLRQFLIDLRVLLEREAFQRIFLQFVAGFRIGGNFCPGEHVFKHVRPIAQHIVQLQKFAAGKFKDQALLCVSSKGKPNKELAFAFARLRSVLRQGWVKLQLGLLQFKVLDAGAESFLRTHGAGRGKQISLFVQNGDAVGGNRGAHPLQRFPVRKRTLFSVKHQPQFRAGQNVVLVNAAADGQFIPVAVNDFRDLPKVFIHQLELNILTELKGGKEHDCRNEQKNDYRKDSKLFPALFPQKDFDFFKSIHHQSLFFDSRFYYL